MSEKTKKKTKKNLHEKTLIIVIDGCAIDYITKKTTPNLYRLAENGFYKTVKSALPSVTNVNHACILSGSFPSNHGVVGNYYYNRKTGEEGFIESSRHMKVDSIIDIYAKAGKSTALLTVKGKVLEVFGQNAQIGINLQKPDAAILEKFALPQPPDDVASFATYDWIFNACYNVINIANPDLVYCTTNDFMMHNYAPNTKEAETTMRTMDEWIGKIYDIDPEREIYITADHGMNEKNRVIDLQKKLDAAGYETFCLLALKDRYMDNHKYQEGGLVYVYVFDEKKISKVMKYLKGCDFVEKVLDNESAAKKYNLPSDNIGDILVLSKSDTAFGELEKDELTVKVRTHGSLDERKIPLIAVNARKNKSHYKFSADIVKVMLGL